MDRSPSGEVSYGQVSCCTSQLMTEILTGKSDVDTYSDGKSVWITTHEWCASSDIYPPAKVSLDTFPCEHINPGYISMRGEIFFHKNKSFPSCQVKGGQTDKFNKCS